MSQKTLLLFVYVFIAMTLQAQSTYKLPPKAVIDLVDAPSPPLVSLSSTKDEILLTEYEPNPTIALLAQPYYRMARLCINPVLNSLQLESHDYSGRESILHVLAEMIDWSNKYTKD